MNKHHRLRSKLNTVSLFTGCGGSDTGAINAGCEIKFANDILPYAKDFYFANLEETDYFVGDITKVSNFPSADLLLGCYPCQGFSQAGARKSDRKINFLYREFLRALKIIKPKAFIVENVSGMQRRDFFHLLKSQLVSFRFCGYKVKWKILKSEDYGVPQERRRIIIVGIRSDIKEEFDFPEATYGPGSDQPYVTIRDSISHLPKWPVGDFWDQDFHWFYMSRNRYRSWDDISKTIVSSPRHMPLHPISPKMKKVSSDKWVLEDDKPARRFSFKEAAILQGFHKDIVFPETSNSSLAMKYKVVGNVVPPALFEAVIRKLPIY
jgi:DNA (cytosine-5)-methyltransferase 1